MAVMQWIGEFFNLNWLDASAVICSVAALGPGIVALWRRMTGAGPLPGSTAKAPEGPPTFRQRRVA